MVAAINSSLPSLSEFMCKRIIFALCFHLKGARYLFFDSAPSTPKQNPAEKYPSIIVRQPRNYAACSLTGERGERRPILRWTFIFKHFRLYYGSLCKYSLNPVIAIFHRDTRKRRRTLKESLPVIASLFTIMASYFHHDKLHTTR